MAPDPASWWNGGGSPGSALGFLSLDDNNNTDANTAQSTTTVTTSFTFNGSAGTTATLLLPVHTSAPWLGLQFLAIDVSGPGIATEVTRARVGNENISTVPAGPLACTA